MKAENHNESNEVKPLLYSRLFKFRAWDEENKQFWKQFFVSSLWSSAYYSDVRKDWIINEFSGLCDKDGGEIYEGDLIENIDGIVYNVIFKDGCFATTYNGINFIELKCFYTHQIKIVGNVYENKELIYY